MSTFDYIVAIRSALLLEVAITAFVGQRVHVAYPWNIADPVYPLIALWEESDNQAVSLPQTNDPARLRVDIYSQEDADQARQIYDLVLMRLHKREPDLSTAQVCIKECRQTWRKFPVWDAKMNAWVVASRFLVRAMAKL